MTQVSQKFTRARQVCRLFHCSIVKPFQESYVWWFQGRCTHVIFRFLFHQYHLSIMRKSCTYLKSKLN